MTRRNERYVLYFIVGTVGIERCYTFICRAVDGYSTYKMQKYMLRKLITQDSISKLHQFRKISILTRALARALSCKLYSGHCPLLRRSFLTHDTWCLALQDLKSKEIKQGKKKKLRLVKEITGRTELKGHCLGGCACACRFSVLSSQVRNVATVAMKNYTITRLQQVGYLMCHICLVIDIYFS